MAYIIDENTIFNTDIGTMDFLPLQDVKTDDYFIIQIATQDNNEVFLIDDTGWTKDVNGSPTQATCELITWWKKVASDDEVPTGINNIGADNTWANIMVVRGLDTTNPIDDSDGALGNTSDTAICPAVTSTQTNQIVLRCVISDAQNLTKPTSLMTIDYKIDAFWGFDKIDAASSGILNVSLAAADQWCASTIILKRASGDTSAPLITSDGGSGYGTLTEKTGITHNGDQWRQEVYDSGKCLNYTGTRETWTVDMSKTWNAYTAIVQCDGISGGTFTVGNYFSFDVGLYRGEIVDKYVSGATTYLYLKGASGTIPINNEAGTEYTDGTYVTPTGVTCLAQGGGLDGQIGVNDIRVSGNMTKGRIGYITNMTTLGVSDGYYWLGPGEYNLDNATLGRYRRVVSDSDRYDAGSVQTLTPEVTGTANVTDVGMAIFDYDTTSPFKYPTGLAGVTYWNANVVGNNRVFTTPQDLSAELMALFWRPASTSQVKQVYFWACDDVGAWKLWKLNPATMLIQDYFNLIDFDSTETPINSDGTFDPTSIQYYAILFSATAASNRYAVTTYSQYKINDMIISGGGSNVPMEMWQLKKWLGKTTRITGTLFEDYFQTYVPSQFIMSNSFILGDGSFGSYIDMKNTALSTLPQANGISELQFNADADKVGIEIDKCAGDITTDLISSDSGWYFTGTSADTIDYNGTLLIKANPTLQSGKTYDGITFVQCKQIIKGGASITDSIIKESNDAGGALLYDTTAAGTISNVSFSDCDDYAMEISGVTDFTLDNIIFTNSGTKDLNVTAVAGTLNITVDGGTTPTYDTAGATVNILTPVNEQDFLVDSVVSGDRVAVYLDDGAGDIDKDTYISHATNNVAGDSDFDITTTIPDDTPSYDYDSKSGTMIVVADDEDEEHIYRYLTWTGSTFTFPVTATGAGTAGSTTTQLTDSGATFQTADIEVGDIVYDSTNGEFAYVVSIDSQTQMTMSAKTTTWLAANYETNSLVQTYNSSDTVYVPYIYTEATGTSVSRTVVYVTDRDVIAKVRKEGILPFVISGTFTSTGYATNAIRTPDPITT